MTDRRRSGPIEVSDALVRAYCRGAAAYLRSIGEGPTALAFYAAAAARCRPTRRRRRPPGDPDTQPLRELVRAGLAAAFEAARPRPRGVDPDPGSQSPTFEEDES